MVVKYPRYPTPAQEGKLVGDFERALHSCIFVDHKGVHHPLVCSVCDTLETNDRFFEWLDLKLMKQYATDAHITHARVRSVYPKQLVAHYKVANCKLLEKFVLSPRSVIDRQKNRIAICNCCKKHLEDNSDKSPKTRWPPDDALIMGYLVGDPPPELTCLNEVELALVSTVRTVCQSWIFFGGCHQHIQGWHTFYDHKPGPIVSHIDNLNSAGMNGQLLVVLCGPFTTDQRATVLKQVMVDGAKVKRALLWLKANNCHYANIVIPDTVPEPYIETQNCDDEDLLQTQDVVLENHVSVTVVLPDGSNPTTLNGGFANQEEFRKFVMERFENGNFNARIHARPSADIVVDYNNDTVSRAFPLIFPYGHSGLPGDPALGQLSKIFQVPTAFKRNQTKTLRRYLQSGNRAFHGAMFILIVFNLLMKELIFKDTCLRANFSHPRGTSFAEQVGAMTVDELQSGIRAVRSNDPRQYSSQRNAQFLRSIHATCGSLPHTNEAAQKARREYFGYVMEFGLPAVFLTLTPDDKRNYRISCYALPQENRFEYEPPEVIDAMSNELIYEQYLERQTTRNSYPGFCAEEYDRITTLVIEHLLQWDCKEHKAKGPGIFGELTAWCLATEEQGRKTLHGHFLLFIKDWGKLMHNVQCQDDSVSKSARSIAKKELLTFCGKIASAKLFQDEDLESGIFSDYRVFQCPKCNPKQRVRKRKRDAQSYITRRQKERNITPVPKQVLREMRHKRKCREHNGHIATCHTCGNKLRIDDVNANAINFVMNSDNYEFPDKNKRIDHFLFNEQMNTDWCTQEPKQTGRRYFMSSVFHNTHCCVHVNRCFAKGCECCFNLPEETCEKDMLKTKGCLDLWFNVFGESTEYEMFRFTPARNVQDAFMNTHSPILTKSLGYNTNVLVAMNGPCVFYVTGYQAKGQQKEERQAYAKVAEVISNLINAQEQQDSNERTPRHEGFRRLLAGVYAHVNAHICAAPMAHYLALRESRFRFSHPNVAIPVVSSESWLLGKDSLGVMRMVNGKATWCHTAMNYIYRDARLKDWTFFKFYRQTDVVPAAMAKTQDLKAYHFTADHPLHQRYVIVKCNEKRVGNFGWSWLVSSSEFGGSLLQPCDLPSSSPIFKNRETYCRRFLMLFKPFQNFEELLGNNESYQEAFREYAQYISEEAIQYGNNIQNIHNSLRVELPMNELTNTTTLDEEAEENLEEADPFMEAQHLESVLAQASIEFDTADNVDASYVSEVINPSNVAQKGACNEVTISSTTANLAPHQSVSVISEHQLPAEEPSLTGGAVHNERFKCQLQTLNRLATQSTLVYSTNTAAERSGNITSFANGTCASIKQWGRRDKLDKKQQRAFEILASTYVSTFYKDAEGPGNLREKARLKRMACGSRQRVGPLTMFITGPAGAGKSKILDSLMAYAKAFSSNIHHHFTETTIRLTAITGAASISIAGDTTCRQFGLIKNKPATFEEQQAFIDTRMNIVDEISFGTQTTLRNLSARLQSLTDCRQYAYGNIPIVFIGDFCQLDGIGGEPIFKGEPSPLWELCLNQMVELDGTHRYKDDPLLGEAMSKARDGDDALLRTLLREREIYPNKLKIPQNLDARYAVFTNQKRSEINASVFRTYLNQFHSSQRGDPIPEGAIIIRGTGKWSVNKRTLTPLHHKLLWERCSDAHITNRTYKADPFLALFHGCEMMVSENITVKLGVANGTCCAFQKAVFKPNAQLKPMKMHGRWVNTVAIDDVDHIVLRFDKMHSPSFEGIFKLYPRSKTMKVQYPCSTDPSKKKRESLAIDLVHFPAVINYATTVHKLQGKSVDNLVVVDWCRMRNWAYVVLSRVRTLSGIFLSSALPDDISFQPDEEYLNMMTRLRQSILADEDDNQEDDDSDDEDLETVDV